MAVDFKKDPGDRIYRVSMSNPLLIFPPSLGYFAKFGGYKLNSVCVLHTGLRKVLPITIPILCAESIADTNTDTFSKSIGDTFTSILLPILLMSPETSLHENVLLLRHF